MSAVPEIRPEGREEGSAYHAANGETHEKPLSPTRLMMIGCYDAKRNAFIQVA